MILILSKQAPINGDTLDCRALFVPFMAYSPPSPKLASELQWPASTDMRAFTPNLKHAVKQGWNVHSGTNCPTEDPAFAGHTHILFASNQKGGSNLRRISC